MAAPSSCTSPVPATRQPPAASPSRACIFCACSNASTATASSASWPRRAKSAQRRPPGAFEHVPGSCGPGASSGARWSAGPAAKPEPRLALIVVGPLAMIDEVEAFALLVGAGTQSHQQLDDVEEDERADARPHQGQADGLGLGDDLGDHVVIGNLAGGIVEHAGATQEGRRQDTRADGADDAADAVHAKHVERIVV